MNITNDHNASLVRNYLRTNPGLSHLAALRWLRKTFQALRFQFNDLPRNERRAFLAMVFRLNSEVSRKGLFV